MELENIRILGVDVFTLTPTSTQPHMKHTLDMSELDDVALMARNARNHVHRLASQGFHFELVDDGET